MCQDECFSDAYSSVMRLLYVVPYRQFVNHVLQNFIHVVGHFKLEVFQDVQPHPPFFANEDEILVVDTILQVCVKNFLFDFTSFEEMHLYKLL